MSADITARVAELLDERATAASLPAGEGECGRCLSRVYRRRDGVLAAAGEGVRPACPAPAAAGGPHVL